MDLFRFFHPHVLQQVLKRDPLIQGHLSFEVRENGKLRQRMEGYNIWTLTGRELLIELMSLRSINPRSVFREDRVAYIGVGTGAQVEVPEITSLVTPVPYKTGEFLARLVAPPTFPSAISKTSVQFIREFGKSEISLGYDVVITEAGLFTEGDPENNWDIESTPTDFASSSSRAPVAYKSIEPVTKTTDSTLRAVWEVRIL